MLMYKEDTTELISVSWNDFHSPPCFLSSIKQIHEGLNKLFNPPGLEFQSHADAKENNIS